MRGKYDLAVVGGGTAGLVAAAGGASLGAKVALVERDRLGGECLYTGCVPTKTLVKSARVAKLVNTSERFGVKSKGAEVDFPAVMHRMRNVVRKAGEADQPSRFRSLGVDVFLGEEASFTAPDELLAGGRRVGAGSVILATGSAATAPPVEGLREVGYLTNVEALQLERLPDSIVVIGSGPVGCEFAQIFARFGAKVTVVSSSPLPLPKEEPEVGELLKNILEEDGVTFHGGFRAESARKEGGQKVLAAKNERGESAEVRSEEILVAAGRAPVAESLRLENAGVRLEKKGVAVDSYLRTSAPDVYAAGDITGKLLFTHVAEYQGKVALQNALFPLRRKADYRAVPWTTFTDPEVARVGMTEKEAREVHGKDVRVFRKDFPEVDRALADGETAGFEKLVATRRGEVLGAHIIGPNAGNLIQEVVLAMARGVPVGEISQTVHVYPTLVQINQRAADEFYRKKLFEGPAQKLFSTFFGARRFARGVRERGRP